MTTVEYKLLGTYRTPRFTYGSAVFCEVRGEVVITGLTSARIPWPVAKRPSCRARALAVFGGLADAIRRESASAITYWWGVSAQTVSKWRREMGVGPMTEGTSKLRSESAMDSPGVADGRLKALAKVGDPERRRKIAASKVGKPRPKHVIQAMRKGRTGKPHSEEAKKKMSEAHLRRGTLPPKAGRPWSAKEDALLGQVPDELLARKTRRKVSAVVARRHLLRVEKYRPWD